MTHVVFVLNYFYVLGYRILRWYKKLLQCHWTPSCRWPASSFVLNFFIVSRLPDISRVQRAVQCRWTPSWRWPASSFFSIIILMFLDYRIFRGYKELCNAAERLPDGEPASSFFSIILMFPGYRIFRGYKELCNSAEHLLDVTRVVFFLNYFNVSRLPDIPRVQRAVQCRWTPSYRWPASSLFSIILMFLGYRIFRGYKELCNAAEHLPDGDPHRLLFLTFLLFPGYRIFRGYKELCNAAEDILMVTCVVFNLNYFNVSRLPDISREQRAVQCC